MGTSFRGDFVRAHAALLNNSSRNFNVWTFLKIDLALAASLSGVGKSSSYDCSGRDCRP